MIVTRGYGTGQLIITRGYGRALFNIYAAVKAKWVFKRERVLRVFKRGKA